MSEFMIKEWSKISANTIEALKIMGMGLLAIFVVIAIIILAVVILNMIDNRKVKMATVAKSNASASVSEVTTAPKIETKQVSNETSSINVANAVSTKDEELPLRSELDDGKYRKGKDDDIDSPYRKNNKNN